MQALQLLAHFFSNIYGLLREREVNQEVVLNHPVFVDQALSFICAAKCLVHVLCVAAKCAVHLLCVTV